MLVRKLALPPYTAVIEWVPFFKLEIEKVPCPDAFKVLEPSVLVPSLNVTVPVETAVPGALATTVAVNVTDWPLIDGFCDEITVVVVASLFTVWVKGEAVLALKLESPLYAAVMEFAPTASVEVVKLAWPVPSRFEVPSVVAPFLNVTVPVGMPPLELTVAVKVTS